MTRRIAVAGLGKGWVLVTGVSHKLFAMRLTDTVILPPCSLAAYNPQYIGKTGPFGIYEIDDPRNQ